MKTKRDTVTVYNIKEVQKSTEKKPKRYDYSTNEIQLEKFLSNRENELELIGKLNLK